MCTPDAGRVPQRESMFLSAPYFTLTSLTSIKRAIYGTLVIHTQPHMNNPLTKYADLTPKDLVFFNYHEYLVTDYDSIEKPSADSSSENREAQHASAQEKLALVVNHFPNPYTKRGDELFCRTRIVRVPRIYDQSNELYMVPQFSTYIPGHEPAALKNESVVDFEPAGIYKSYPFGHMSLTPLVPGWLSEETFCEIVQTVNRLVNEATTPEKTSKWLESALDFFTGTIYSTVLARLPRATSYERNMRKLDAFVAEVNMKLREKHEDLQVIPLWKSAMLSLDFQVPMVPGACVSPEVTIQASL